LFVWNLTLRKRNFFDGEDRFARDTIENERKTGFRDLGYRIEDLAIFADLHQDGLRRKVVIPKVVMNRLEMPEALARGRVQCDQ